MKTGIYLLSLVAFFFVACGSDSGTGSGIAQAETVYGLGECEGANEGVVKWVISEDQYYTCRKGGWESDQEKNSSEIDSRNDSRYDNSGISSGKDNFPYDDNRLESENITSSSHDTRSSSSIASSSSSKIESSGIVEESVYDSIAHTLTDLRDGHIYQTFDYNGNVWMAENLNYRYLGPTATNDSSSFCLHDDPENCDKHGRLYLFSAAIDSMGLISDRVLYGYGIYGYPTTYAQDGSFECWSVSTCHELRVKGVCPSGWHLLSNRDISQLDTDGLKLANWLKKENMFHALWGGSRRSGPYRIDGGCPIFFVYEDELCTGWWFTSGNYGPDYYILPNKLVLEGKIKNDSAYVSKLFDFDDNNYQYSSSAYYVRCVKD